MCSCEQFGVGVAWISAQRHAKPLSGVSMQTPMEMVARAAVLQSDGGTSKRRGYAEVVFSLWCLVGFKSPLLLGSFGRPMIDGRATLDKLIWSLCHEKVVFNPRFVRSISSSGSCRKI